MCGVMCVLNRGGCVRLRGFVLPFHANALDSDSAFAASDDSIRNVRVEWNERLDSETAIPRRQPSSPRRAPPPLPMPLSVLPFLLLLSRR